MTVSSCLSRVKRSLCEAGVSGGILVAVSGGPDSAALLHMLCEIGEYELYAAHLNHGIRGETASRDAAFVRELTGKLDIPYFEGNANVPEVAELYGISIEEAARNARYEFLRRIKKRCGAQCIVTAHHEDDQAETVLMHIIRGSGLTGICGMRVRAGDIVRPMLGITRAEIIEYIELNNIAFCTDETNLEPCCTRNRIRLGLMNELKKYNPSISKSLASLAELAARDEDYFEELTVQALDGACFDANTYERRALSDLPYPIKSRAAMKILQNAGIGYDRAIIERMIWLFDARTGASFALPDGMIIRASYQKIIIEKQSAAKEYFEAMLSVPGETPTPNGSFIASWASELSTSEGTNVAFIDADKLPERVIVRPRQNGDRFHPFGSKGAKKLKDYLIDKKIPREERDTPLLACEKDILFFPGGTVSESLRVTKETKRLLRVEYLK